MCLHKVIYVSSSRFKAVLNLSIIPPTSFKMLFISNINKHKEFAHEQADVLLIQSAEEFIFLSENGKQII